MPFITVTYPPKYPLTESEKKWLEERERTELTHGLYSCAHCWHCTTERDLYYGYCTASEDYCLIEPDFRDAAEFEARVAVYMTKGPCFQCKDKPGPNARYCIGAWGREGAEACRLKHARLAVEEQMEAESARR